MLPALTIRACVRKLAHLAVALVPPLIRIKRIEEVAALSFTRRRRLLISRPVTGRLGLRRRTRPGRQGMVLLHPQHQEKIRQETEIELYCCAVANDCL